MIGYPAALGRPEFAIATQPGPVPSARLSDQLLINADHVELRHRSAAVRIGGTTDAWN